MHARFLHPKAVENPGMLDSSGKGRINFGACYLSAPLERPCYGSCSCPMVSPAVSGDLELDGAELHVAHHFTNARCFYGVRQHLVLLNACKTLDMMSTA